MRADDLALLIIGLVILIGWILWMLAAIDLSKIKKGEAMRGQATEKAPNEEEITK